MPALTHEFLLLKATYENTDACLFIPLVDLRIFGHWLLDISAHQALEYFVPWADDDRFVRSHIGWLDDWPAAGGFL